MTRGTRITGWQRVAGAMWKAPDDPQIFGALELDAVPVLAFIDSERVLGRAMAHAGRSSSPRE